MKNHRVTAIRDCLTQSLSPDVLEVEDESHLHAGHAGAKDGRGHFRVTLVAPAFSGLTRVHRHQLVYGALGTLMQTDIHALAIHAIAPEEI